MLCSLSAWEAQAMQNELPTLLTLTELSRLLRLSPDTIRDRVKRGILPAVRLTSGKLLFHPRAVNRALRQLSTLAQEIRPHEPH